LVIVNGASFIGRLSVGVLAKYINVTWLTVVWTAVCAILIFALTGVKTVAGFVIFGIIFGLSAGACKYLMLSA
jgi:hypothetical protein